MRQPSAGNVSSQVLAQLKWVLNDDLSVNVEPLVERNNLVRIRDVQRPLAGLNDLLVNWSAHKWTDDLAGEWEAHVESEELQEQLTDWLVIL